MWEREAHVLAPLIDLLGKGKWKLEWTDIHQKAFDDNKSIMTKETILNYPKYGKLFNLHIDASDRQLGATISPNSAPLSLYSRKLNSAQRYYNPSARELLSLLETLKEFRNTDH